jgi:hypothetical protein
VVTSGVSTMNWGAGGSVHQSKKAVYSLFGDGEGRGYTVCTSVNICQSNQWNSAARMSLNFHHTLYISDYNVSPKEICGTIVAEFSLFSYISD